MDKTNKAYQLFQKLKKYKVISFDVFDTLIFRDIVDEAAFFNYLEEEYLIKENIIIDDFPNRRFLAQKEAKAKYGSSMNLNNIYDCFNISEGIKEKLIEFEILAEMDLCVPNPLMKQVYELCVKEGKRVIFTTDMYLKQYDIRRILDNLGYIDGKIYVSNECSRTKKRGDIWREVLAQEQVDCGDVVHIGDNLLSDYISARSKGMKAILSKCDVSIYCNKRMMKDTHYFLLHKILANRSGKYVDSYERIGYEVLGPILYGFAKWLNRQTEGKNLLFLSREGLLLKKAYEILYKGNYSYINISRKAVRVPGVWKDIDEKQIKNHHVGLIGRLSSRLQHCISYGFSEDEARKALLREGYMPEESIEDTQEIVDMIDKVASYIYDYSREQYDLLLRYLLEHSVSTENYIVDIGWHGSVQYCLELLGYKIDGKKIRYEGRYVGVNNDRKAEKYETITKEGYLFNPDDNTYLKSVIRYTLSLFELLFLSTERSTMGYEIKNEKVVPVFEKPENDTNSNCLLERMQNAALDCVEDLCACKTINRVGESRDVWAANYVVFADNPSLRDVKLFSAFFVNNGENYRLIPEKGLLYYCIHPHKFYVDFSNNGTKLWFLKKVFGAPISYVKLLRLMSKFDGG